MLQVQHNLVSFCPYRLSFEHIIKQLVKLQKYIEALDIGVSYQTKTIYIRRLFKLTLIQIFILTFRSSLFKVLSRKTILRQNVVL